jgi:succinate dehydrogenase hydrophobic anchor subunit
MATIQTRPQTAQERSHRSLRQMRPNRTAREWRYLTYTGVGLLVLLTVHMVAQHFVVEETGGLRSYQDVLDYVANPVIFTIEAFFLLFVTVHALLGLRNVLFDLDPTPVVRRWINRGLTLLGFLTVGYSIFLLATLASRA